MTLIGHSLSKDIYALQMILLFYTPRFPTLFPCKFFFQLTIRKYTYELLSKPNNNIFVYRNLLVEHEYKIHGEGKNERYSGYYSLVSWVLHKI